MTKATQALLQTFKPGDRVQYIGKQDGSRRELVGRNAKVRTTIKSRELVVIEWDQDGKRYDAMPISLVHI